MTKEKQAKSEEVKKDLFRSLSTLSSHDPQLRKESKIKILEIGVGTGELLWILRPPYMH